MAVLLLPIVRKQVRQIEPPACPGAADTAAERPRRPCRGLHQRLFKSWRCLQIKATTMPRREQPSSAAGRRSHREPRAESLSTGQVLIHARVRPPSEPTTHRSINMEQKDRSELYRSACTITERKRKGKRKGVRACQEIKGPDVLTPLLTTGRLQRPPYFFDSATFFSTSCGWSRGFPGVNVLPANPG